MLLHAWSPLKHILDTLCFYNVLFNECVQALIFFFLTECSFRCWCMFCVCNHIVKIIIPPVWWREGGHIGTAWSTFLSTFQSAQDFSPQLGTTETFATKPGKYASPWAGVLSKQFWLLSPSRSGSRWGFKFKVTSNLGRLGQDQGRKCVFKFNAQSMAEMKVIMRVWILKEMVVHLYFVNCWMFCDRTWYVSAVWPDAVSCEAYFFPLGSFVATVSHNSLNCDTMFAGSGNQWFKPFDTAHLILAYYPQLAMQMKWPSNNYVIRDTVWRTVGEWGRGDDAAVAWARQPTLSDVMVPEKKKGPFFFFSSPWVH